ACRRNCSLAKERRLGGVPPARRLNRVAAHYQPSPRSEGQRWPGYPAAARDGAAGQARINPTLLGAETIAGWSGPLSPCSVMRDYSLRFRILRLRLQVLGELSSGDGAFAGGDQDAASVADPAAAQVQRKAPRGGLEGGDRLGHGRDGAKRPCLLEGPGRQARAADAAREAQVVADQRAAAGLPADGFALEQPG